MSAAGLAIVAVLAAAGPKVEFGPLRPATMLPMGQCEVEVGFRLVVHDGGVEDYYCPGVQWQWEDGSIATEETDCPPFAEAGPDDHRRVWMPTRSFQKSGRYVVRARLVKADRVIRKVEAVVVVKGWSGYPDERRQEFGCSPARSKPEPPPAPFPPLAPRTPPP